MFLANTIKILFVIVTLLQPCHAMIEKKEPAATDQAQQTSHVQDFTYSGLFAKQLEAQAQPTCDEKCMLCMCFVCPCTLFIPIMPGVYAGALGVKLASLITANTNVHIICGSIVGLSAYVPIFKFVSNLAHRRFADAIRNTCNFFIQQNKLGAISEYLFMLTFCDRLRVYCDASLSWREQASVINDYLKTNGSSCTVKVTLEHNEQTGDQQIVGKTVWVSSNK